MLFMMDSHIFYDNIALSRSSVLEKRGSDLCEICTKNGLQIWQIGRLTIGKYCGKVVLSHDTEGECYHEIIP